MSTLSLAAVLAEAARRHGDRVAVVDPWGQLTYRELWSQALAQAGALASLGVGPGSTVALMCPNVNDFPRTYYAALAAGATVMPVHLLLTPHEAADLLRDSGSQLLVAHTARLAEARAAAEEAGVDLLTVGPLPPGEQARRLEEVVAASSPLPGYVSRDPMDPAVVFYTSGTTGTPKGALLSHLNLVMNVTVNAFDANDTRREDVVLGCLPLFHTFGQTVAMNTTFRVGAKLVLLPRFSGEAALELMVAHGVDVFQGVPTMFHALLAAAGDTERLPRLRMCVSGGASLPVSVLERFQERFSTTVFEGYGLSETSPTATTNQPHFGTRAGTVGHPVWGVEVEIADPAQPSRIELLPTDQVGEVVIRGHNVFSGYLGRPEATAEVLVDGWFRTGDLGSKDADGFIRIVDRTKDLVIRGGFNVYPREVEDVLITHPAVAQVAVIGLPDEVHGEEICAVVVPEPGAAVPEPDELVAWSRERLGGHKYPRQIRYVQSLPLGPSMKVLKRELRRTLSPPAGEG